MRMRRPLTLSPLPTQEDGTALVSGCSGQLLRLSMEGGVHSLASLPTVNPVVPTPDHPGMSLPPTTPESLMLAAIKCGRYDEWTVVD